MKKDQKVLSAKKIYGSDFLAAADILKEKQEGGGYNPERYEKIRLQPHWHAWY